MAITRERKEQFVAKYVDLLDKSNGFIIIESKGLTVPQIQTLRAMIREAEGYYLVAKNTLFTKALQQRDWPVPDNLLKGPTAVAFGMENLPGVAKAVLKFTEEAYAKERVVINGGVMGASILNAKQVDAMSKLPTLDELRAQIAGLMVSPAQGLVNVIYAATGQVVNVLQAYIDDRGEGEAA